MTNCDQESPNSPCNPCDTSCPDVVKSDCVIYTGDTIAELNITNGDTLTEVIESLNYDHVPLSWLSLSLNNTDWSIAGGSYQRLEIAVTAQKIVYLRGVVNIDTEMSVLSSSNVLSAALATNYRPLTNVTFISKWTNTPEQCIVTINTSGVISVAFPNGTGGDSLLDLNLQWYTN